MMGLLGLASHIACTCTAYLYPSYATYKAIKASDGPALERLMMYWVVIGIVATGEGTVQWLIDWFPFYYEAKTIFILWLALPQIQGSSYVYVTHLQPFLLEHEKDIDAALIQAKEKAKSAGLEYVRMAIVWVRQTILGPILGAQEEPAPPVQPGPPVAPPTAQNPASGAAQQLSFLAGNLLRQYGPAAAAMAQTVLNPMSATNRGAGPTPDAVRAAEREIGNSFSARSQGGGQHDPAAGGSRTPSPGLPMGLGPPPTLAGLQSFGNGGGGGPAGVSGNHPRAVSTSYLYGNNLSTERPGPNANPNSSASYMRDRRTSFPSARSSSPASGASTPYNNNVRDPVAERYEASILGQSQFEKIDRDEATGWGRNVPPGPGHGNPRQQTPNQAGGGAGGAGGWWPFGGAAGGVAAPPGSSSPGVGQDRNKGD